MRVFSLAIDYDYKLAVELFSTREAAEKGLMQSFRKIFGDDGPDSFAEYTDWVCGIGDSINWNIEEHDSYVDSPDRITL